MPKYLYEYKHKVTGGSGLIEAESEEDAKAQVPEIVKFDTKNLEETIKIKDVEITVTEYKEIE